MHMISKLVLFMHDKLNVNFNKKTRVCLLMNIKRLTFIKF